MHYTYFEVAERRVLPAPLRLERVGPDPALHLPRALLQHPQLRLEDRLE
jgi:hypothetical protein